MRLYDLKVNIKRNDVVFVGLATLVCIFRIYLASTQSYWALGGLYDDGLQNKEALSLMQGNWLGAYDQTTLIKGISFPAFLAVSRLLHLKYGMALGLFICASCIVFLCAARKFCKNRIALFVAFCTLLFCPVAWCTDAGVRIYRNVLSPWTALTLFSCLLALFQIRHERILRWLPWLVLLGLTLAFATNLREDAAWMYPAIAITLIVILVSRFRKTPNPPHGAERVLYRLRAIGAALVPLAICALVALAISTVNNHYYGVFLANDRSQGSFSDMVAEISKVKDENKDVRTQWVTQNMIAKAMGCSPSFDSIHDEIDAAYEQWAGHFGDGTVRGDYLQWVLRTAMTNAGLYGSAAAAQDFSSEVAQELSDAFRSGQLESDSLIHPSSQGPGLSIGDCIEFIPDTASNTVRVLDFSTIKDWFPLYTELAEPELTIFQQTTGLAFSPEAQDKGHRTHRIENVITATYQFFGVPLFVVGCICSILSIALSIKTKKHEGLAAALFNFITILGSALLCVYIVTIFITFLGGTWPLQFYATPAYVLFLAFDAIAVLNVLGTINHTGRTRVRPRQRL